MTALPHHLTPDRAPQLGLIVLQSDETIELDFRRLLAPDTEWMVNRIPSDTEVSTDTLAAMEGHMTAAASLFPKGARMAAIGYGCTSGAATIGPQVVAQAIRRGCATDSVTEPVSALVAACRALNVSRLAVLSPYVAPVSARLFRVLAGHRIDTPVFGSFDVAEEARVVRIDTSSIVQSATLLARQGGVDALFLSCTNLRALEAIPTLEAETGLPVLASNQVLAWHMAHLSGTRLASTAPGQLCASPPLHLARKTPGESLCKSDRGQRPRPEPEAQPQGKMTCAPQALLRISPAPPG